VHETFAPRPIKVVESIRSKISELVQPVCIQKKNANAEYRNETQELATVSTSAHFFTRTRRFQGYGQILRLPHAQRGPFLLRQANLNEHGIAKKMSSICANTSFQFSAENCARAYVRGEIAIHAARQDKNSRDFLLSC
jgi:hypothetical protein